MSYRYLQTWNINNNISSCDISINDIYTIPIITTHVKLWSCRLGELQRTPAAKDEVNIRLCRLRSVVLLCNELRRTLENSPVLTLGQSTPMLLPAVLHGGEEGWIF
jgi:hypothetical protein